MAQSGERPALGFSSAPDLGVLAPSPASDSILSGESTSGFSLPLSLPPQINKSFKKGMNKPNGVGVCYLQTETSHVIP